VEVLERERLERVILEAANSVLLEQDYVLSTWKNLRMALGLRKGIYEDEEFVEEVLCRHAKELFEVYRQIPEPDEGSISEEELQRIKEEVKEGKDRWVRNYKAREGVRRLLREKGYRIVDSFVERMVKKVERMLKEELQGVGV